MAEIGQVAKRKVTAASPLTAGLFDEAADTLTQQLRGFVASNPEVATYYRAILQAIPAPISPPREVDKLKAAGFISPKSHEAQDIPGESLQEKRVQEAREFFNTHRAFSTPEDTSLFGEEQVDDDKVQVFSDGEISGASTQILDPVEVRMLFALKNMKKELSQRKFAEKVFGIDIKNVTVEHTRAIASRTDRFRTKMNKIGVKDFDLHLGGKESGQVFLLTDNNFKANLVQEEPETGVDISELTESTDDVTRPPVLPDEYKNLTISPDNSIRVGERTIALDDNERFLLLAMNRHRDFIPQRVFTEKMLTSEATEWPDWSQVRRDLYRKLSAPTNEGGDKKAQLVLRNYEDPSQPLYVLHNQVIVNEEQE